MTIKLWFLSSVAGVCAFAATTIDLEKSRNKVEFLAVGSPSAIKIHGKVDEDKTPLKGKLAFEGTAVSGEAKIPLDAFDTGIALRNKHMKETYLETATYPTSELKLTKLTLPSAIEKDFEADSIPFEADLSLHGTKKPVKGVATVKKKGNELSLEFNFKFPLSDFGVKTPSFMGVKVTEDVKVDVAINAVTAKR